MEERQRNFLAATAKRRAEEKQETERLQRLRAAGITDTSEYRPSDWSAPVGADVQAVAELLTVRSTGVAPRCQSSRIGGGCSEADAAQEADEVMAAIRASVAEEELHAAAEVEGDALVVELVGAGLDAEAFSTSTEATQAEDAAGLEEEPDGGRHARASGLGSELLARLATLEASALAQRGGLVEWAWSSRYFRGRRPSRSRRRCGRGVVSSR